VDSDLETLATELYVTCDDLLKAHPEQLPPRPRVGFVPGITDAELITLSVMQALLGFTSETRWLRHVHKEFHGMFPTVPQQSGYNKRLRKLAHTIAWLIARLGHLTPFVTDDVVVVDSTPVECGRSRETAKRSDLAGWAGYGYCASHSRWFWGLRLHLICTLHGLPLGWALTEAAADEREVAAILATQVPALQHRKMVMIGDKNYYGRTFEADLAENGTVVLRPARKGEPARPGPMILKSLRQTIESINQTLKGQLDLERHGGRTHAGVCTRVAQRILALTAAIWHNQQAGQTPRHLTPYDH
jgi:Transposase DDE domain